MSDLGSDSAMAPTAGAGAIGEAPLSPSGKMAVNE